MQPIDTIATTAILHGPIASPIWQKVLHQSKNESPKLHSNEHPQQETQESSKLHQICLRDISIECPVLAAMETTEEPEVYRREKLVTTRLIKACHTKLVRHYEHVSMQPLTCQLPGPVFSHFSTICGSDQLTGSMEKCAASALGSSRTQSCSWGGFGGEDLELRWAI
jgi:hypothetical protein